MPTEKQGATKRQHYVPQMILRNFSRNDATTSLMVLSSGKRVPDAAINRQCYEPYFYGADQIMEQSFANEEAKISRLLGDLSRERLETVTADDITALKFFVHYQAARTRASAESLSNFATAFLKTATRGTAKLNGDQDLYEAVEKTDIRLTNAQNESLWQACKTTPMMYDLDVRFLVASREQGFVIGDHPVVAYNQFAEHHPVLRRYPTITGLAVKGLQLFMPLSPSVTLALYDPGAYEFDGKRVCGAGPRDVRFLNAMQTVNAWQCVFFDAQRTDEFALDAMLAVRRKHPSRFEKSVATSDMIEREDGSISQFVVVTNADVRVGARLSFLRTTDQGSYRDHEGATIPVRSEAILRFTELYGKELDKESTRRAAAGATNPGRTSDPLA